MMRDVHLQSPEEHQLLSEKAWDEGESIYSLLIHSTKFVHIHMCHTCKRVQIYGAQSQSLLLKKSQAQTKASVSVQLMIRAAVCHVVATTDWRSWYISTG